MRSLKQYFFMMNSLFSVEGCCEGERNLRQGRRCSRKRARHISLCCADSV